MSRGALLEFMWDLLRRYERLRSVKTSKIDLDKAMVPISCAFLESKSPASITG